jgi:glycosyltransferase involved in cell wall biosynthesis
MKILHIIRSLSYSATTRQLGLLCRGLPSDEWDSRVCVLGPDVSGISLLGPAAKVHILGKTRSLDLVALWKLRRLVRSFQPHIIDAWGPAAIRHLALAGRGRSRLVVHAPFSQPLKMLDRWLLRQADSIIVRGQAEAERCRLVGLLFDRIEIIEPGIDQNFFDQRTHTNHSPLILCAGKLKPDKGYRDAIWALDIVRFLFPDIHLALAGAGPDRERLEYFAGRNQLLPRVSFLGSRADISELLARATMVWVPSLGDTGLQLTLEATAAGKPVIAANVPSLREIITDGRNGFLIAPGDKVALARRTRELLRNPDLARRLGESARRHALAFSADRFVQRTATLYRELAPHAEAWKRKVAGEVLQWRVPTATEEEPESISEGADWEAVTSREES